MECNGTYKQISLRNMQECVPLAPPVVLVTGSARLRHAVRGASHVALKAAIQSLVARVSCPSRRLAGCCCLAARAGWGSSAASCVVVLTRAHDEGSGVLCGWLCLVCLVCE